MPSVSSRLHRQRPAKKLAQQTPAQAHTAKKIAQHGKNRPFYPILGTPGEEFRVCNAHTPRRANFLAQLEPRPAAMKPTAPLPDPDKPPLIPLTPLQAPSGPSLKPLAPLQVETRLNSAILRPQRCRWFQTRMMTSWQRRCRCQATQTNHQHRRQRFQPACVCPTDTPTQTHTPKVACNSSRTYPHESTKSLESQGSVITARRTHWGIACETAEHPGRRHTRRGR